jgi:hypothetical protein
VWFRNQASNIPENGVGQQNQPFTPSLSVSMPLYRVIRVRMVWLWGMFILGAISQFLLAVWAPSAWNYLYTLTLNFLT